MRALFYNSLPSYFLAFSIWTQENICLDWDSTIIWANKIGVKLVPIISREYFSEQLIRRLEEKLDFDNQEGYVVRLADSFHYDNFALSVAKYVRPRHVQTSEHWMKQPIVNNLLAG